MRVQNVFINSIIMYIFSYQANILFYSKNHKEYFLLVHMKAVLKRKIVPEYQLMFSVQRLSDSEIQTNTMQ